MFEDARYGEDKRGDKLPPELAEKTSRLVKMAAARKQLEEEAADKGRRETELKARDCSGR